MPIRTALSTLVLALAMYGASSWIVPSPASACSCGFGSTIIAPVDQASDVPTNARLWVKVAAHESETMTITLEPATASVGAPRDIQLTGGDVLRSFSLDNLEPGQTYTASVNSEAFGQTRVTFQVADVAMTADVPVPTLVSCEEDKETESLFGGISSCGEWHKMDIEARAPQAAVMLALREGDGELNEAAFTGKVTAAVRNFGTDPHRFYLGNAPCGPTTWNVDEGSTTVRVASYDIAGNFSGWTAPNKVVVGCEGGGGDLPGAAFLAVIALAFWSRRRSLVS